MGELNHGISEKQNKQLQAILYAIQCFPEINRTRLMKYIFFADLFTYNKCRETLLEDKYKRLPNGPVPVFGFRETDLPIGTDIDEGNKNFIKRRIYPNESDQPEFYRYKFELKMGVDADMTVFKKKERNLLDLTLRSVMSRKTAYISQLTHTYSLWRNHENYEFIELNEFQLNDKEMNELELFLNAKVYLTSMRKNSSLRKFFSKGKKKGNNLFLIDGFPEHLPVYIDDETGEIVK